MHILLGLGFLFLLPVVITLFRTKIANWIRLVTYTLFLSVLVLFGYLLSPLSAVSILQVDFESADSKQLLEQKIKLSIEHLSNTDAVEQMWKLRVGSRLHLWLNDIPQALNLLSEYQQQTSDTSADLLLELLQLEFVSNLHITPKFKEHLLTLANAEQQHPDLIFFQEVQLFMNSTENQTLSVTEKQQLVQQARELLNTKKGIDLFRANLALMINQRLGSILKITINSNLECSAGHYFAVYMQKLPNVPLAKKTCEQASKNTSLSDDDAVIPSFNLTLSFLMQDEVFVVLHSENDDKIRSSENLLLDTSSQVHVVW